MIGWNLEKEDEPVTPGRKRASERSQMLLVNLRNCSPLSPMFFFVGSLEAAGGVVVVGSYALVWFDGRHQA